MTNNKNSSKALVSILVKFGMIRSFDNKCTVMPFQHANQFEHIYLQLLKRFNGYCRCNLLGDFQLHLFDQANYDFAIVTTDS